MSDAIRTAFRLQAGFCRQTGSEMTGRILEALAIVLDHSTKTGARILDWSGDPMIDALKLRIAGGLNALARSGHDAELSQLYAQRGGDFEAVFPRILREHDDWLFPWLDSAPQTNEVARSGVLWPGMLAIASRFGPDLEILELGASGGLNLNMDRFAYRLGETPSGDLGSLVQIAPAWTGTSPQPAAVRIVARAGVDLNPLDLTDDATADRMMAYIWPDQEERIARASAAIAIARAFPPPVEQGDGAEWIERQLAMPQKAGVTRVIYHSIALQYFPPEGRKRVRDAIHAAGERASAERPLAWLWMEFPGQVTTASLDLTCWPGGESQTLAHVHPHGASVNWSGGA
jgi:hypothetical protein